MATAGSTRQSLTLGNTTLMTTSRIIERLSCYNPKRNGRLYDYVRFANNDLLCDIDQLSPFLNRNQSETEKAKQLMFVFQTKDYLERNRLHNSKQLPDYEIYKNIAKDIEPLSKDDFQLLLEGVSNIQQNNNELKTSKKAQELVAFFSEFSTSNTDILSIITLLLQQSPNTLNEIVMMCATDPNNIYEQQKWQSKVFQATKVLSKNSTSIIDLTCLLTYDKDCNDILLENSVIYNSFTSQVFSNSIGYTFVIEPTAFFIRKYLADPRMTKKPTLFFTSNENLPYIFSRLTSGTSSFRFLKTKELFEFYDSGWIPNATLIFGNHFSSQKEKNSIISFLISNYREKSSLYLFDYDNPIESPQYETHKLLLDIDIHSILLFPARIIKCTNPQRKMLAICEYGEYQDTTTDITLSQFKLINNNSPQALSCKTITSSISKHEFNVAAQSLRNRFRNTSEKTLKKTEGARTQASIFNFSSELEICYTVSEIKGSEYIRLRAYCRNPINGHVIKSSVVSTKKCKQNDIPEWLLNVYPYANTKQAGKEFSVRNEIASHYKEYLANKSITLKTFLYLYANIELPKYGSRLLPLLSSYFGDYLLDTISNLDIEEFIQNTANDSSIKTSPSQVKAVLSKLYDFAISQGHCKSNPIAKIPASFFEDKTELYEVRQNLTKKFFYKDEMRRIIAICNNKINKCIYEYIGVLIRLFTGLDSNTISGLKWKDFRKVTYKGHSFYQLVIRRCVNNAGTAFVPFNKVESFRFIPCISTLAKVLRTEYNRQLQSVFNGDSSIMADYAIVPGNDIRINGKFFILSPQKLNKLCRKVIKELNIDPDIIPLPDDSTGYTETNLSFYGGDIFSENFRHQLVKQVLESAELPLETELFSNGELSYLLGNKADSTFFNHYCDLGREDSQATLYSKLTMAWEEISK